MLKVYDGAILLAVQSCMACGLWVAHAWSKPTLGPSKDVKREIKRSRWQLQLLNRNLFLFYALQRAFDYMPEPPS